VPTYSSILKGDHSFASGNAVGHRGMPRLGSYESRFLHKEVSNMNLNLTKSLGMLLLGIWLIVMGLLQVLSVGSPIVHVLLALLAIAAGIFIVLGR
jgi:hypothetical protein